MDLKQAKFTKIAFNPREEIFKVKLFVELDPDRPPMELDLTQPGKPSKDVVDALADLRQDVVTLCELGQIVKVDELEVRSVSMQHAKGVMRVVISAPRTLKNSSTPLNLHTPLKVVESEGDGEGDPNRHLDEDTETRIRTLVRVTREYLQGNPDGAQGNLFAQPPAAAEGGANGHAPETAESAEKEKPTGRRPKASEPIGPVVHA